MNHESVAGGSPVRQVGVAPEPAPHSIVRERRDAQPENVRSCKTELGRIDEEVSWGGRR